MTYITKLASMYKNYYTNDSTRYAIDKLFNRGQGRLMLFQYYPSDDVVLVNSAICTMTDIKRITKEYPLVKLVFVDFGYPEYNLKSSLSKVYYVEKLIQQQSK